MLSEYKVSDAFWVKAINITYYAVLIVFKPR
jgi:hypothetical protein